MRNNNTLLIEMLQVLEPLRNMQGYNDVLMKSMSFSKVCNEISFKTKNDDIIIVAKSEEENSCLVIKGNTKINRIGCIYSVKEENKRALR